MKNRIKKYFVTSLIIVLALFSALNIYLVNRTITASADSHLFEFSFKVMNLKTYEYSSDISTQELLDNYLKEDDGNNYIRVGVFIKKNTEQVLTIDTIEAGVVVSDSSKIINIQKPRPEVKFSYKPDPFDPTEESATYFLASGSNSQKFSFAWNQVANDNYYHNWAVPAEETLFATVVYELSSISATDYLSIGMTFKKDEYIEAALEDNSKKTTVNYLNEYGENCVKVNFLQVGEIVSEPSADIDSLFVAGNEVMPDSQNPNNYTVSNLPFQYTTKALNELIKPILSSATATVTEIKRTRTEGVNRIISGDIVTITVTDGEGAGIVTKTYTIKFENVQAPELVIDTLNATVGSGISMPSFNGNQNFYTINIPYGVNDTIKFKPTLKSGAVEYATITASFDGTAHPPFSYESGVTQYEFSNYSMGLHTIKLTVKLKEGFSDITPQENVYTFNIEKQAPDTTATVSNVVLEGKNLSGSKTINRNSESDPFVLQEDHTYYTFTVYYEESTIQSVSYEYFVGSDKLGGENLTKQGSNSFKAATKISIAKGQTYLVKVTATAQDGSKHIYEFLVKRPLSSNCTIGDQDLSIQEGGQTTIIKPTGDKFSYTLKNSGIEEIYLLLLKDGDAYRITALAEGGNLEIYFGENKFFDFKESNSNSILLTVPNLVGTHEYTIIVTAADSTTKTYSLEITRQSNDATIKSIIVTIDGETVLGTADFSLTGGQYANINLLAYDKTKNKSITLTLTSDEKATIKRNTALPRTGFSDENYGPSAPTKEFWVNFKFLENIIQYGVTVTAQDGTSEDYIIILKREAADTNATLSVLTANDITPQGFVSGAVGATYPNPIIIGGIAENETQLNIAINAETSSAFAQAVIIKYRASLGNWQTLPAGIYNFLADRGIKYEVEITVTAQDGISTQTYNFYFIVAEDEDVNKEFIAGIKLSERVGQEGTPKDISFVFNSGQQNYEIEVASTTSHIMFVVTAKGKFTTISIGESSYTVGPKTITLELSAAGSQKTFIVKSKSEAGTDGKVYTFTIKRKAYNNNVNFKTLLLQLTKNDGTPEYIDLTSEFESKTSYSYYIERLSYASQAVITATIDASTGSTFLGGDTTYLQNVTLNGTIEISITIRADNPEKIQVYKLTLCYLSGNTEIDVLILNGIQYYMSDFENDNGQKVLDLTSTEISYSVTYYSVNLALKAGANSSVAFNPALDEGKWVFNGVGVRQLKFTVTAEDGKTKTEYIVKVFRKEPSSDTSLEYIKVIDKDGNNLLEGVTPTGTSVITYKLQVSRDTKISKIDFAAKDNFATAEATNFDKSAPIELIPGGSKDFNITVTAQNGSKQYYVITIIQLNSIGGLNNVEFSGINYDFGAHTEGQSINLGEIEFNTTKITITIVKKDAYAVAEVKNKNNVQLGIVSKGEQSKALDIYVANIIDNQFSIEVVSDDGSKKEVYFYTFTIKQPAADAQLSEVTIKLGSEDLMQSAEGGSFESQRTNYVIYKARTGYENQTVRIQAVAINGGTYVIKLPSGQSSSTYADWKLLAGENIITIEVTAQNQVDKATYTVKIIINSDKAEITDIKITELDSFAFNSANSTQNIGKFEYNELNYGSINFSIIYNDVYSTLTILEDGEKIGEVNNKTNHTFSYKMKVGSHSIAIVVTSESGKVSKQYTLTYERGEAKTYNKLDNLSVTAGGVELLTGDYEFDPDKNSYTIRIDRNIDKIYIAANIDIGHRATVLGSGEYAVSYGSENKFAITVTAENGEQNIYYIIVKVGNLDTQITDIQIEGTDYEFSAHTGTYSLGSYFYSINKISVTVTKNDPYARLYVKANGTEKLIDSLNKTVSFDVDLAVGSHEFEIYLRPDYTESTDKGQSYVFSYTRNAVSKVASLKSLTVEFNGNNLIQDKFSPDVLLYDDIQINAYQNLGKDITFKAEAGYMGTVNVSSITEPLQKGKKEYSFVVTAEDGITKRTYTVIIYVYNDGNKLSNIAFDNAIIDSEKEIVNGKQIVLSKVGTNVSTLKLTFTLEAENIGAVVKRYVSNNHGDKITSGASFNLNYGQNTFTISVRSEYSEAKDNLNYYYYTFVVEREQPDNDTTLKELKIVSLGLTILGLPNQDNPPMVEFSPETFYYEFNLTRQHKMIKISALAVSLGATISGCGDKVLVGGLNPFYITVNNQGHERQYIVVINVVNCDVEVKNISLSGLNLEFDKDVYQYELTVPNSTSSINVIVDTTDNDYAKITGSGWHSLQEGNNIIVVTISSEDGSKTYTYTIKIFREKSPTGGGGEPQPKSSDATLYDLYIEDTKTDYPLNFSKDKKNYSVTLNSDDNLFYLGYVIDAKATIVGAGRLYNVAPGERKTITIQVTAEDGTKGETYTLEVYVLPLDTDNSLKELKIIEIDGDQRTIVLDHTLISQVIEVSPKTNKIIIEAITNSQKATVLGGGEYSLDTAETTITIIVQSEAGQPRWFTVIIKKVSSDNTLKELKIYDTKGNLLNFVGGNFNPEETDYRIDLTGTSVSEITIEAKSNCEYATVTGTGTFILNSPEGQSSTILYMVTVRAQNGEIRTYRITVVRDISPNDSVSIDLLRLTVDNKLYLSSDVTENPTTQFVMSITTYDIFVPYGSKTAYLNVVNNNGASVISSTGIHAKNLTDKVTTYVFKLKSKSTLFESDTYTINIIMLDPDTDNTLQSLYVNEMLLVGFSPSKTEYELTYDVEKVTKVIIEATPNSEHAKVSGTGEHNLSAGKNYIMVTVTAEDGSIKTYTILINCLSFDAGIALIAVEGHNISPQFDPNIYSYTLNVEPFDKVINILVNTTSDKATVYGNGSKTLVPGENVFYIYAVAESGTKGKTYVLTINQRIPSSDTTLKSLVIKDLNDNVLKFSGSNGEEVPFSPDQRSYIINLPEDTNISAVTVIAETNDSAAKAFNTGSVYLEGLVDGKYHTVIKVPVMAEDGTIDEYIISIYRNVQLESLAEIYMITVIGSDAVEYLGSTNAKEKFIGSIQEYIINVPYYVKSVTLLADAVGTVYGEATKFFGSNLELEFNVYALAQDQATRSLTYKIKVIRQQPSSICVLNSLTIDGVMVPDFSPDKFNYTITLPTKSGKTSVIIGASAADCVTIQGIGEFELKPGINIYTIIAKAEDESISTYTITINYVHSNALLGSLMVKGCAGEYRDEEAKEFLNIEDIDPIRFEYNIIVDKNTTKLRITGTTADMESGARVSGFREYDFPLSEQSRVVEIEVISADGLYSNVYCLRFTRSARLDSDSQLESLSISGYAINFNPNVYSYKLRVGADTNKIDISAKAFSANAKITVEGYQEGQPSNRLSISLDDIEEGKNAVLIRVEAEDGSITYYKLSIIKDPKPDYLLTLLLIVLVILWIGTVIFFMIKQAKLKLMRPKNNGNKSNNR